MKKIFFTIVLFFTTILLVAQNSDTFTGSLLWKISGNGLSKPSYIVGTHHFIKSNFADSIKGFKPAFDACEQVVGELLLDDMPLLQAKVQVAGMLATGESYYNLLTESEYDDLDSGLKLTLNMGLEQLGVFRPAIISILYTVAFYSKLVPDFNLADHISLDQYVLNKGRENGKSVAGLETVDEQIHAVFDAEPLADQAKGLVCLTRNSEYIINSISDLNTFYRKGDLNEMYRLSFDNPLDPCLVSEAYKNSILKERNNNWLERLPDLMQQKPSFIAVGALHLAGEEGLLFQLSRMGYLVEPVK